MMLRSVVVLITMTALFAVSCGSAQMKREVPEKTFTKKELARYDGTAYVAVDGVVYDVTGNDEWCGGEHKFGIRAGQDVSEKIDRSPHGRGVLNELPVVGRYIERTEKEDEAVYTTTGEPIDAEKTEADGDDIASSSDEATDSVVEHTEKNDSREVPADAGVETDEDPEKSEESAETTEDTGEEKVEKTAPSDDGSAAEEAE